MAVSIDIKGRYLNTKNLEVQIEDENPATNFDECPGDQTINIELPANDVNRAELNNPDRFEKMGSVDDRRFDGANVRHNGQIVHSGTLIIEETTSSYSGYIRGIVGKLAEETADKYINKTTLAGLKVFANKSTYDPDSDDYACPKIFNRQFWYGRGSKEERSVTVTDLEGNEYEAADEDYRLVYQHLDNFEFFINYPVSGGVHTGGEDAPAVVTPMLFLWRVVELILSDYNIFVKDNFLKSDSNLKKLILYSNFSITKQEFTTEEETLYDYDSAVWDWVEVGTRTIKVVTWVAGDFYYKDLIPKISLGEFIVGLQNYLNVVFSFNDLGECRIVDRQNLLTAAAYDIDEYMVGDWELGTRKDVAVKLEMEHDDNDAAFSDNFEDLSDIRENIKEPSVQQPADLDDLEPEMDEIRKVESNNSYYQYHWHTITVPSGWSDEEEEEEVGVLGWEKLSIGFQPYFYNDNGDREVEDIKTGFSTLQQSENGYPISNQPGSSEAFKTQANEFSPRLLFYLGNEFASHKTGTMSLDWSGNTGLAKTRWNYWLPFWANRLPATGTFKFPASVFYYIKNNKSIIPFRTRHGSFIIDKITAIAGNADKITAELQVYKRESVVSYQEGTTPGEGGISTPDFVPAYVGVTAAGKPYLVNTYGDVRIPPAWGTLSSTDFASTTCVDYDPVNHLLFVGGLNGTLYITDLSDIDNITMKSIKVFASGVVSGLRYANDYIMIARDAGIKNEKVYAQPYHADINDYDDGQALEGTLENSYAAKDFFYYDTYYYAVTKAGEFLRTYRVYEEWAEITDRDAHFLHIIGSDNYFWLLEDDDRNFRIPLTTPYSGHEEWDLESGDEPPIVEAIHKTGDTIICITTDDYQGLWVVDPDNKTLFTPSLAKQCGGVCMKDESIVVAIQEASGATKIAMQGIGANWSYINVPQFFKKLWTY